MLTDVESESEAAEVFLTSSRSPPSLTGGLTATDSFSAQLSPPSTSSTSSTNLQEIRNNSELFCSTLYIRSYAASTLY